MDGWIEFWTVACLVGFAAFFILAAVLVPLGARDLLRLLRHLNRGRDDHRPRP